MVSKGPCKVPSRPWVSALCSAISQAVCGLFYVLLVGRPGQVSTPEPCGGSGPYTTTNP